MCERITQGDQLAAHAGQIVAVEGLYRVQNIFPRRIVKELPDGSIVQSSKVVHLALGDETTIRLWVRPNDEMAACSGNQVVATGKLVLPEPPDNPAMAAPDPQPSLVDIQSVEKL